MICRPRPCEPILYFAGILRALEFTNVVAPRDSNSDM
jgi:hypothetical protein